MTGAQPEDPRLLILESEVPAPDYTEGSPGCFAKRKPDNYSCFAKRKPENFSCFAKRKPDTFSYFAKRKPDNFSC